MNSDNYHGSHSVLIEAESFDNKGGWKVDQQFVHSMGSPYLLAHGMGVPVANAKTKATFPVTGNYHFWVRTMNWVPGEWEAPGRFKVIVNDVETETVFGTQTGWGWQSGGEIEITKADTTIELKDLTGFEGRCDAIYFSTAANPPLPNTPEALHAWRNRLLGLPETPTQTVTYDLVVVGGGIAGCAAALAAEKEGLSVALVNDRPVLGGNASEEVRVHCEGIHGKGKLILEGIDTQHWLNGDAGAIADNHKRQRTVDAARGVTQYPSHRAYQANMQADTIDSVDVCHVETGMSVRLTAPVFIDSTGDGWIGYWAGASFDYGRESLDKYGEVWQEHGKLWSPKKADNRVMGTSVLWNTEKTQEVSSFPEVPWALPVSKGHAAIGGEWYWEYSDDKLHQIDDAEEIRDHMLRAIYGSFYNAKQDPKNAGVRLKWVGYIGGKRESRRLVGDYVYTQKDMTGGQSFPDAVVEETRQIDVHHQNKEAGGQFSFLSTALFMETPKYYLPFRCFYSESIANLMMAGRCFSCSHVGLGGPRNMNTTGQMGIATGYAAALCKKYRTNPRGIYREHIDELRDLIGYEVERGHE